MQYPAPVDAVPPAAQGDDPGLADLLDAIVTRQPRLIPQPGCIVSITLGRGAQARRLIRPFGRTRDDDQGVPIAPDTIFLVGSITKVFTAVLLAMLAREGVLDLDEPANDVLPDGVRLPHTDPAVTLAHLATHSAGLPLFPRSWLQRSLDLPGGPYAGLTLDDLAAAMGEVKIRTRPGERVVYSNLGYGLLGAAISHRTGTPYERLVLERICAPLGLGDTRFSTAAPDLHRLTPGHDERGTPITPWTSTVLAAAGALRSTVQDVMTFLGAHLDVTRGQGLASWGSPQDAAALDALALAMAQTHHERLRSAAAGRALAWQALGWQLLRPPGVPTVLWHNGEVGGFRSYAALVPEAGVRVAVLTNTSRSVDQLGMVLVRELVEASTSAR